MDTPDGDTKEILAQKDKEIGELKKKLTELEAEKQKADTRVENAQKKIDEWSKEIGEMRKTVADLEKKLKEQPASPPPGQPTTEEIEASLTAEEQAVLDAAWEKATPEEQELLTSNDTERRKMLLRAKRAVGAGGSPERRGWRKVPASKPAEGIGEDALDRMFNLKKRQAEFVPDGSGGGSRGGRTGAPPVTRKADWIQ